MMNTNLSMRPISKNIQKGLDPVIKGDQRKTREISSRNSKSIKQDFIHIGGKSIF